MLHKILKTNNSFDLVLRLVVGAIFIYHGYGKLININGTSGFMEMLGLPFPHLMAVMAALGEFVGGVLIIIGLLGRLVGLNFVFIMGVALIFAHAGEPIKDLELQYMLLASGFYFLINGIGKLSIDKYIVDMRLDKAK